MVVGDGVRDGEREGKLASSLEEHRRFEISRTAGRAGLVVVCCCRSCSLLLLSILETEKAAMVVRLQRDNNKGNDTEKVRKRKRKRERRRVRERKESSLRKGDRRDGWAERTAI